MNRGHPGEAFPIMAEDMGGQHWAGGLIPWALIAPHEAQARANHYQSLAELARRGGLSWSEALAVLEDRPWKAMGADDAKPAVIELAARHLEAQGMGPIADALRGGKIRAAWLDSEGALVVLPLRPI